MTAALIIAIILAVCVVYALGVYHGQHHGREQRKDLASELNRTRAMLTAARDVAYRTQVYDHERSGL